MNNVVCVRNQQELMVVNSVMEETRRQSSVCEDGLVCALFSTLKMPPRRQHNQRPVFALMHNWERVSMNEILAAFSMVMTGAILLAALYFLPDASTSLFNRSIVRMTM